jgi:CRISPR-associated protein Csb2
MMADFSIGIRYLTGYAVATYPASRERPEWPPHPARVFMALAAAHFETEGDDDEAAALRWLEELPHPTLHASDVDERRAVTTYVPINDDPIGKSPGLLQSVAGWPRSKQPRMFPRVRPHDDTVFLIWPGIKMNEYRESLDRLCGKVTRIGHSSSLVQMWVATAVPEAAKEFGWEPDDLEADVRLRTFGSGTLKYLEQQFGENQREMYRHLNDRIVELERHKKAIKGRGRAERKAAVQQEIDQIRAEQLDGVPSDPQRPVMSLWQGYRRYRPKLDATVPATVWDANVVVRRLVPLESHHRRLDLAATLQLTAAMHRAVIDRAIEPVPEFICGHQINGSPTEQPHLAYLPLPFVGTQHATGHIMGLAIAVPSNLDRQQRRSALAAVGQVQNLTIGPLGRWKLDLNDLDRFSLRPEATTGGSAGATTWATVTPIAFDQHPKAKERSDRERELALIINRACARIGLPEPIHVIITPISPHLGVPPAHEFPRLKRKDGSLRRHAHAVLTFDTPVRGPITLGAGRYRGYGFCEPLRTTEVG